MHPPPVRARALELIAAGHNDCQVARIMGIPRGTIRDWRRPTYVRKTPAHEIETCPRCWRAAKPIRFTAEDYSELLALYLGDGYISKGPRTMRLRIALDLKYPTIIRETKELLERSFPENAVDVVYKHLKGGCVNVSTYSNHLPCLFPQHGPGKKHERRIVLEDWQETMVQQAPWAFLRGCIRSDGCVFVNRTDIHRPRPYEYPSYNFNNMSEDIVDLFTETCELVGIADCRVNRNSRGLWDVRINRRESVALMLQHVGLKT
jgi:Homeodomain-like domain